MNDQEHLQHQREHRSSAADQQRLAETAELIESIEVVYSDGTKSPAFVRVDRNSGDGPGYVPWDKATPAEREAEERRRQS